MGQKPKYKMSRIERAKQFMPFAALKGFEEAIIKQEKLVENNQHNEVKKN